LSEPGIPRRIISYVGSFHQDHLNRTGAPKELEQVSGWITVGTGSAMVAHVARVDENRTAVDQAKMICLFARFEDNDCARHASYGFIHGWPRRNPRRQSRIAPNDRHRGTEREAAG